MQYDKKKLTKYLLGELSEADAEAFDEASFSDARFADDLSAAENDLIDAYLQNELKGAEREKFETVYPATKHRREKVEFARSLQTFAEKEISAAKPEKESAGFFASWNIFNNRAWQFGFAAAALLVLFFGIFWFAIFRRGNSNDEIVLQKTPTPQAIAPENKNSNVEKVPSAIESAANDNSQKTNQKQTEINRKNANKTAVEPTKPLEKEKPVSTPQKPIIATFFLAPPLRSANKIPLFNVPKTTSQINIGLQLEADEYDSYHVTLINETGDINLWRRGSLKSTGKNGNKVLNVSFPAKLLNSGFYSLTVSGVTKNGEAEIIANYPFRVGLK